MCIIVRVANNVYPPSTAKTVIVREKQTSYSGSA